MEIEKKKIQNRISILNKHTDFENAVHLNSYTKIVQWDLNEGLNVAKIFDRSLKCYCVNGKRKSDKMPH